MKIFYDFEFVDNGRTTDPLSLGMAAENGDELYRIFQDGPWYPALQIPWMRDNVLDKLPITYQVLSADGEYQSITYDWDPSHEDYRFVMPRKDIADEVEDFLRYHGGTDEAKLWGDYPASDHVALYQLFGPMIECTKHGMPMRTSCLEQEEDTLRRIKGWYLGSSRPEQDEATEHHALHDARHNLAVGRWLGVI